MHNVHSGRDLLHFFFSRRHRWQAAEDVCRVILSLPDIWITSFFGEAAVGRGLAWPAGLRGG